MTKRLRSTWTRRGVVLLLAAVMAVAYMPFVGNVYADKVPGETVNGAFSYDVWEDSPTSGSIALATYSGSEKQVVLPTTATNNQSGKVYDANDGKAHWAFDVGEHAFDGVKPTLQKVAIPNGYMGVAQNAFN